ncbi:MAG: hypothetical protein HYR60_22520 [Acidobacteria bacterium]|nr:hypothetical protein [Acidobacteriota bacterium]
MRLSAVMYVIAAAFLGIPVCVRAQPAGIDLHQNWDQKTAERFWFTSQGSRMMPYDWFLALEQASNTTAFRDPANMERLRYIQGPASELNPDNLPIGFVKDIDKADVMYLGLTCAACHTAEINVKGVPVIVQGGPTLADFSTFLKELVDALSATLSSEEKFNRFARRVLGPSSRNEELRTRLESQTALLSQRKEHDTPKEPYGYGRLDAFGLLFNQVLAHDLNRPNNVRAPSSPVSYPFLWDTPQHDFVQWNGVVPNTKTQELGSLMRNIAEVLGVFGQVDVQPRAILPPGYSSSIPKKNLRQLEASIRTLWSPVWPRELAPLNRDLAEAGKAIYANTCIGCHPILDRTDPRRTIKAKLVPVEEVGTDPTMARNFVQRVAETGPLENTPKNLVPLIRFGPDARGIEVLTNIALGVYLKQLSPLGRLRLLLFGLRPSVLKPARAHYKARPLNGIWATAPYLHNGSVPSLRELLKTPSERVKTFYVGSRDFDPDNVGLSTEKVDGAFLFDTSKTGNSNQGHPYSAGLNQAQRDALLEYLKTL